LAALYAAWYLFGPEAAQPDMKMMRMYRLSQLSDADLHSAVAEARKRRVGELQRRREGLQAYLQDAEERSDAREKEHAEWILAREGCDDDPVFKLRNEDLCNRPQPGGGMLRLGPATEESLFGPLPTEDEFIDGVILGACAYVETVREARKQGCLAPH